MSFGAPKRRAGFIERPDCRIAYEMTGDGPPIVLLNGAFRDHTIFDALVPELAVSDWWTSRAF